MKNNTSIAVISALSLVATAALLIAGPLNPAPGSVAPTYKTLTEIEPRVAINAANTPGDAQHLFTITQSGSYYLTGNITVPANLSGIGVFAANVTIDLNGFTLAGGVEGINGSSVGGPPSITVRNGTLKGGTGYGLALSGYPHASVEHVNVLGYSGVGIQTSIEAHVSDCSVRDCAQGGIHVNYGSIVERCTVDYNGASGSGDGIRVSTNSRVIDCSAVGNYGKGITTSGNGCIITGCTSGSNAFAGFELNPRTVVERCVANSNGAGFVGGSHCSLLRCSAISNSTDGFLFQSADKVAIIDCEARGNGFNPGIGGITVQGVGGRIESCLCVDNVIGIFVTGTDNIIVKNSCRANSSSNFQISAGNELAPVITNPGSNGFSTMTPWSNIAY